MDTRFFSFELRTFILSAPPLIQIIHDAGNVIAIRCDLMMAFLTLSGHVEGLRTVRTTLASG